MKKYSCLIATFCILLGCSPNQQTHERSLDREIVQVIDQLYDAIDFDRSQNQQPDWEKMRSVFIEEGQLIHVGDSGYVRYETIDDYIQLYRGDVEAGNLSFVTEHEIDRVGDVYANIAQVFSSYEAEIVATDTTINKRGINSIQLLREDGRWKIASIIWYDETGIYPIPDRYLSHVRNRLHSYSDDMIQLRNFQKQQEIAHLTKDADLLVGMFTEQLLNIDSGVITKVSKEDARSRFQSYFDQVEFVEWENMEEPVIRISKDGTMAYVTVRKFVHLKSLSEDGTVHETRTEFAWLETWEKINGQWLMMAIASTDREPNPPAETNGSAARYK